MNKNHKLIAGVDEAGRGPLAGPVYAAAVILDPNKPIANLKDSKELSAEIRESLAKEIMRRAKAWGIAFSTHEEIDAINILQASLLAMQRAVAKLTYMPHYALVDGKHCPQLLCPAIAIIEGDKKIPAISAASILAKVARDQEMQRLEQLYPGYGFGKHKGYPTPEHFAVLQQLGPCEIHRRSFVPVKEFFSDETSK